MFVMICEPLALSRSPRTRISKSIYNVKTCVSARTDEMTVIKTYNNIKQHTKHEVTQNTNILYNSTLLVHQMTEVISFHKAERQRPHLRKGTAWPSWVVCVITEDLQKPTRCPLGLKPIRRNGLRKVEISKIQVHKIRNCCKILPYVATTKKTPYKYQSESFAPLWKVHEFSFCTIKREN